MVSYDCMIGSCSAALCEPCCTRQHGLTNVNISTEAAIATNPNRIWFTA